MTLVKQEKEMCKSPNCMFPMIVTLYVTCWLAGVGTWAVLEHNRNRDYNDMIVEATCQIFPNTLRKVNDATCEEPENLDPWNIWSLKKKKSQLREQEMQATRANSYWEITPCEVERAEVTTVENGVPKTRNVSKPTLKFKNAVENCQICEADRKEQTLYTFRTLSCKDIYGSPVKSCDREYQGIMNNEAGMFPCSYEKDNDKRIHPGNKQHMRKATNIYMTVAIVCFVSAAVVLMLGCGCAFCCLICSPPERLDEEADALLEAMESESDKSGSDNEKEKDFMVCFGDNGCSRKVEKKGEKKEHGKKEHGKK